MKLAFFLFRLRDKSIYKYQYFTLDMIIPSSGISLVIDHILSYAYLLLRFNERMPHVRIFASASDHDVLRPLQKRIKLS